MNKYIYNLITFQESCISYSFFPGYFNNCEIVISVSFNFGHKEEKKWVKTAVQTA